MNLVIKKKSVNQDNHDFDVFFENQLVGFAEDNYGDEEHEYLVYFDIEILENSKQYSTSHFFQKNIFSLIIPIDFNKYQYLRWNENGHNQIWFEVDKNIIWYVIPDLIKWDKPFSFISFLEKLSSALSSHNMHIDVRDEKEIIQDGFNIKSSLNFENNLKTEYSKFLSIVNNEIKNIFEEYKNITLNTIVSTFNFPNEIKQACEQYLIYFSKFLEDFGIEIHSQLESNKEETILTITPNDDNKVLRDIRDLLDFYLSLPNIQNLEVISLEYKDVSVQQLIANIYHLKSQLLLATSMIENKNATIESLQFSNFQKQNFIDQNSKKNEEKTLDGLISIQEFEYKGLKLNLPEVFRRLKRIFSKK